MGDRVSNAQSPEEAQQIAAEVSSLNSASEEVMKQIKWCSEAWGQLQKTFAWGVPTAEAIKIAGSYGPLIEAGAGSGYWLSLLRQSGVSATGFDAHQEWNKLICSPGVQTGGPE